jgi:hypothetical protein
MTTLQEYLNNKYNQAEREKVKEIDLYKINQERQEQGIDLNENQVLKQQLEELRSKLEKEALAQIQIPPK